MQELDPVIVVRQREYVRIAFVEGPFNIADDARSVS